MTSGPLLVLVTGLPCSGKTGIASRLSAELALPMLAKDDIKEGLFDTLGYGGRERSLELSRAAYAILYRQVRRLLSAGLSLIAESNFDPVQASAAARGDPVGPPLRHVPDPVSRGRPGAGGALPAADGEGAPPRARRRRALRRDPPPKLERGRLGLLDMEGEKMEVDTTDFSAVDHDTLAAAVRRALKAR